jgi:hypothetical protein
MVGHTLAYEATQPYNWLFSKLRSDHKYKDDSGIGTIDPGVSKFV